MLKLSDICERYGVGRSTVLSWIESGALAAIDTARSGSKRKFYRISPDALKAFEAARSSRQEPPAKIPARVRKLC